MKKMTIKIKIDELTKKEFQNLCGNLGITFDKGIYYLITNILINNTDEMKEIVKEMKKFEMLSEFLNEFWNIKLIK